MRFRLTKETVGFCRDDQALVRIEAGDEVNPVFPVPLTAPSDPCTEVLVSWKGKTVSIFLVDLMRRGERIQSVVNE